ncbi:MAG: DUF916 domain-containing protein, partial [Actinobacteria bacterium]|nr:DUF916 domain-containing protein [Actinomycetota bacterium]
MRDWRRTLMAVVAVAAVITLTASPTWARSKRTTTTTSPPAPGAENAPPGAVVNSWALAPAGSTDPRQPGDRPNFSYSAAPGSVVTDQATLFNYSNVELTFHVYATDAFNELGGEFGLLPESKKPTDVGTWVVLPQANLTLPPQKQATFPITVKIPSTARPGDHVGAILASNDALGAGPSGKLVNINRRTGSRLYVRVAGPLQPELAISKISSSYHPRLNPLSGPVDVTYEVENRGNVRLGGQVQADASGVFGLGSKKGPRIKLLDEVLPGQKVRVKAHFKGIPATFIASAH